MKKILILAYFFPPMGGGGVLRMVSLARHLPALGWEPHIITVKEISHYFKDTSLLPGLDDRVTVYRTGSMDLFRLHALFRRKTGVLTPVTGKLQGLSHFFFVPDNRIGWYPFAYKKSSELLRTHHFDAILSSSPPNTSHLIAHRLHKKHTIPWVVDYRDLWVDNPNLPAYTPVHKCIHTYFERKVLVAANRITVVSPAYKESIIKKNLNISQDNITVITNGYDEELFAKKRERPDKFIVTHAGIFSGNRRPDTFLRACGFLQDTLGPKSDLMQDLRINFIGPGGRNFYECVKKYRLEEIVTFRENVSQIEAVDYLLKSAVNLLILSLEQGHDAVIPSKLFEYLATRNPILALCGKASEVARIIRETSSGTVVAANDWQGIADALKKYYQMFKNRTLPQTPSDAIEKFSRKNCAKQFAELLNSL